MSEWTQISPDLAEPEAGHVGGAGCWAGLCVEVSLGRLGPCTSRGAPDALDGQLPPSLRDPTAAAAQSSRGFSSDSRRRWMFPEIRFSCSSISELHACSCMWGCKLVLSVYGAGRSSPWSTAFTCGLHSPPHDPATYLHHLREGGGRLGQTPLWPLGRGGPGHPL